MAIITAQKKKKMTQIKERKEKLKKKKYYTKLKYNCSLAPNDTRTLDQEILTYTYQSCKFYV